MIKGNQLMDEHHEASLLLMKPGVWYCFSAYRGCNTMPTLGTHDNGAEKHVNGAVFAMMVRRGFVESKPVFEGFMTEKHKITPVGIDWLASR